MRRRTRKPIGYMIDLGDEMILSIAIRGITLELGQVNLSTVTCRGCRHRIPPEDGIQRTGGNRPGYLCVACTQKMILSQGSCGYDISGEGIVGLSKFDIGRFSAAQVAARIERNRYVQ